MERVNRGFIKDIVKFGALNGRNHSNYYLFNIVDKNYLLIFLIEYKLNENDQNILTINKDRNTLSNTSNTTELKFNKVDRDGDVIASDTTFTLTKLSHNPDDLDNLKKISSYIDYTTLREEDGTFEIKDLDRGLYVLSETNPPKDYKKADRDIVLQIIEGDDGKLVINSYEKDEDDNLIKSDRFKYLDNTKNPIEIANDKEAQYIIFNKVTNAIFGYSNIESGELELTISKYDEQNKKASDLVDTLKFDLKDTKSINKIYIEDADGKKKLEDGKYLIKETKAPEGYVMTNRSYLVEISTKDDVAIAKLLEVQDSKGNAITDKSGKEITDTGEQIPEGGLEITDKKGGSNFKIVNNNPSLPSTGGNGTFIGFALIGTAIMIAAIAYYGIYINDKNRRRSNRYNK